MDFSELKSLQDSFDRKHGWTLKTEELPELLDMLHRDVVGLIGEVGEFANILKKITLVQNASGVPESNNKFKNAEKQLAEELIDALIYIMRIASHLKIDIEKEYIAKLDYNTKKYREYET